MQKDIVKNYRIDISTLYTVHCSDNAIDWVCEHLGGFDKLTDICCHIGLGLLKGYPTETIQNMIAEVINYRPVESYRKDMVNKVLRSYATVLKDHFLGLATLGDDRNFLNHVTIYGATLIRRDLRYNTNIDNRRCVSTELTASFHWHSRSNHVVIQPEINRIQQYTDANSTFQYT